jgi:hypothetical protein
VYPVTHTTTLRVAALLGASSPLALSAAPVLKLLPPAHDVANGWDVQLGRSASLRGTLASGDVAFRTAVSSLLLAAEPLASSDGALAERALLASALDRVGLHAEAGALLEDVTLAQRSNGSFDRDATLTAHVIDAVARHGALTNDSVFAETFAPTVAGGLEFILKHVRKDAASAPLLSVASMGAAFFRVARDPRAAAQVAKAVPGPARPLPVGVPSLPARSAGASFVPEDAARLHLVVRSHIESFARVTSDEVTVLEGLGMDGLGQPYEARGVPTPCGRLSFVVRWHGERPALLWECAAVHDDQRADDLVVRVPNFGGAVVRGAKGETLLPAFSAASSPSEP